MTAPWQGPQRPDQNMDTVCDCWDWEEAVELHDADVDLELRDALA